LILQALMPRGTYFSCFAKKSKQKKAPLVSAPTSSVPSLRTIEAVAIKTRPTASNIDRKNPAPLVPRSA
jgi:hypothetical protein